MDNNQPAIDNSRNTKSIPLIIGGLILLLLVGSGSFILGQRSVKQEVQTTQIPTIVSTPTSPPIITSEITQIANWKTYTNQNVNIPFSFQYPSEWYLNTNMVGGGVPIVVVSTNIMKDTYSRSSPCFSVGGGLWPSYVTLEQIIKEDDASRGQKTATSPLVFSKPKKILSQSQIVVDNIVGIKRNIIRYDENTPSTQIYLAFPYKKAPSDIDIIKIATCQNTDDDVVNKILSTFKDGN